MEGLSLYSYRQFRYVHICSSLGSSGGTWNSTAENDQLVFVGLHVVNVMFIVYIGILSNEATSGVPLSYERSDVLLIGSSQSCGTQIYSALWKSNSSLSWRALSSTSCPFFGIHCICIDVLIVSFCLELVLLLIKISWYGGRKKQKSNR